MGGCRVFTTLGSTKGGHSELVLQRIGDFLQSATTGGHARWKDCSRPGGTATATMLALLRHSGMTCGFLDLCGLPLGDLKFAQN